MKIYGVWMSLEPGIVGIYASKEEAEKGAHQYLLDHYGDTAYLGEMNYDEFSVDIELEIPKHGH